MGYLKPFAEISAAILEAAGILIILVVAIYSIGLAIVRRLRSGASGAEAYRTLRQVLANGILLGLELLVAADIINTVAIELTFTSVGVLALIVLVRTFLSFTLEVEMTGRWPWQQQRGSRSPSDGS